MATLTFTISAPMQSYGLLTFTAYRRTAMKPTKRTIRGLIAAAYGYRRNDPRIQELGTKFDMTYKTIKPGSLMCDYQNAHYQKGKLLKNRQIWRYYLQDASFEITLHGDSQFLKEVKYKLQHPYFSLYVGRRSCPLDRPLSFK